ncbi:hypothetical protein [Methylobacterium segetis]|uniref:hypothetical protein n=1 Tax=Methylobacterium segetis TaxID=2488750 RepID=UPI00104A82E3|nr:hypothetical protein [Methylobacterium segetis]
MTTALEHLAELASGEMADAAGDTGRMSDLISALTAAVSLAIATQAEGDPRVASFLCERTTDLIFKTVSEHEREIMLALRGFR